MQFNTDYFKSPKFDLNKIYCCIKCTQRIYKEASKVLMGKKISNGNCNIHCLSVGNTYFPQSALKTCILNSVSLFHSTLDTSTSHTHPTLTHISTWHHYRKLPHAISQYTNKINNVSAFLTFQNTEHK